MHVQPENKLKLFPPGVRASPCAVTYSARGAILSYIQIWVALAFQRVKEATVSGSTTAGHRKVSIKVYYSVIRLKCMLLGSQGG